MGGGPRKDALHRGVDQHADVSKGVDAFDLEFSKGPDAYSAIRAIGVRFQLTIKPVDGRVAGFACALGRAGIL